MAIDVRQFIQQRESENRLKASAKNQSPSQFQQEVVAAKKDADFKGSAVGIAKNIISGVGRGFQGINILFNPIVRKFAFETIQGISRSGGSVGISYYNKWAKH